MKQTLIILTTILLLQGCASKVNTRPCTDSEVQIANMTDTQYQRCRTKEK